MTPLSNWDMCKLALFPEKVEDLIEAANEKGISVQEPGDNVSNKRDILHICLLIAVAGLAGSRFGGKDLKKSCKWLGGIGLVGSGYVGSALYKAAKSFQNTVNTATPKSSAPLTAKSVTFTITPHATPNSQPTPSYAGD